jgi:hypothetical protein
MDASFVISRPRNEGIDARAEGDKLRLQPANEVSAELQALVRRHKDEILAELRARWNGHALPRNFICDPPRPDERANEARHRPVAITGKTVSVAAVPAMTLRSTVYRKPSRTLPAARAVDQPLGKRRSARAE